MNKIVNLSQLITSLAEITESDTNTARRFLHELFALIETELISGNEVTVKGIGTFRRIDDADLSDSNMPGVGFIPADVIADAINAPFSMFEPVELADNLDEAALAACDNAGEVEENIVGENEIMKDVEEVTGNNEVKDVEGAEETTEIEISPLPDNHEAADDPEDYRTTGHESSSEGDVIPEESIPLKKNRPLRGLWALVGLLLGLSIGYVISWLIAPMPKEERIDVDYQELEKTEDTYALPDEQQNQTATESESSTSENGIYTEKGTDTIRRNTDGNEPPVYDEVTRNRFLTTMSRAHYGGVMEYWVYIYEANRDHLGNPDRIEPGTRVLIPPMSSFAPDGDTPAARAEAVRLAAEIYSAFR